MPWIEISEKEMERRERRRIMTLVTEAEDRGDLDEARRLEKQFAPQAEVLMNAKLVGGADFVRETGWDTRHADKKYGPDWLDR